MASIRSFDRTQEIEGEVLRPDRFRQLFSDLGQPNAIAREAGLNYRLAASEPPFARLREILWLPKASLIRDGISHCKHRRETSSRCPGNIPLDLFRLRKACAVCRWSLQYVVGRCDDMAANRVSLKNVEQFTWTRPDQLDVVMISNYVHSRSH